ncbi:MAG: hypothetical protein RLZZ436_4172 [Planctomycetota bacterium]
MQKEQRFFRGEAVRFADLRVGCRRCRVTDIPEK